MMPAGVTTWTASAAPYFICGTGVTVGLGSTLVFDDDVPADFFAVDGGPIEIAGGAATGAGTENQPIMFGADVSSVLQLSDTSVSGGLGVELSGISHAELDSDALEGAPSAALTINGNSTAVLNNTWITGGAPDVHSPALDIEQAARLTGACITMIERV